MPFTGGAFTGGVAPSVVALTDGASIAVNAALGNIFGVVLGGNRVLANPTSPAGDGQKIIFAFQQDGTGSRILSYGTAYVFSPFLPAPFLSTTPGKTDYVGFIYSAAASAWRCLAFLPDF